MLLLTTLLSAAHFQMYNACTNWCLAQSSMAPTSSVLFQRVLVCASVLFVPPYEKGGTLHAVALDSRSTRHVHTGVVVREVELAFRGGFR